MAANLGSKNLGLQNHRGPASVTVLGCVFNKENNEIMSGRPDKVTLVSGFRSNNLLRSTLNATPKP